MKRFLSGDEALAEGVRLSRPQVISAYPITPQTVVVERLSEMVADGSLDAQYMHVESEHSALSCAMGASATGARTFTATSSQGLLYMAEALTYAAGGRFPIVMMNANRSTALPWNIYGDQRDSLGLLDHGWIQAYALDNQEALDLTLMAYAIAENLGYSAGPAFNRYYKYYAHQDMLAAEIVIDEVESRFAQIFGRTYPGMVEAYRCDDAEFVVVTLGSIAGLVRNVVDDLREQGKKVGLCRIRYMRPFPYKQLAAILGAPCVRAAAVLEKDISFGGEGTVFTNVNSALHRAGKVTPTRNFVGGLGGDDISYQQIVEIFETLEETAAGKDVPQVSFLGVEGGEEVRNGR